MRNPIKEIPSSTPFTSVLLSIQFSIIVGSFVIAIAILLAGGILQFKNKSLVLGRGGGSVAENVAVASPEPSTSAPSIVDIGTKDSPVLGNKDAKITIVEFADLRCPYCEKFFTNTKPQIMKDYVDSGKVKFVFRHYAFLGPASTMAANAAECADDQGKFWEMHDYLYKNQPDESDTSMYTVDKLTTAAGTLGINTASFRTCLDSEKDKQRVSTDMSDAEKIGVSGTPSFVIGKADASGVVKGQLLVGAQPFSAFKTIIDQQLSQ